MYSMIDSVAWQCTPCRQSEVCFDIFQTAIAEYDVQDSESDLMYFTDDNGSALVVVEREDDQSEVLPFSDYSSFAVVCVREE